MVSNVTSFLHAKPRMRDWKDYIEVHKHNMKTAIVHNSSHCEHHNFQNDCAAVGTRCVYVRGMKLDMM